MVKRKPTKTILDGELAYMVRTAKRTATRRGDIPLGAVATKKLTMAEDVKVEPSERVTVKLICKPGEQSKLIRWINGQKGKITSQVETGEVFLVDLPVTSIQKLNRTKFVQRAEAARVLLPRLDEARGAATGLDQALGSHELTGDGAVFGIVDSGLDWSHPDFQDNNGQTRLELFTHALMVIASGILRLSLFPQLT